VSASHVCCAAVSRTRNGICVSVKFEAVVVDADEPVTGGEGRPPAEAVFHRPSSVLASRVSRQMRGTRWKRSG